MTVNQPPPRFDYHLQATDCRSHLAVWLHSSPLIYSLTVVLRLSSTHHILTVRLNRGSPFLWVKLLYSIESWAILWPRSFYRTFTSKLHWKKQSNPRSKPVESLKEHQSVEIVTCLDTWLPSFDHYRRVTKNRQLFTCEWWKDCQWSKFNLGLKLQHQKSR